MGISNKCHRHFSSQYYIQQQIRLHKDWYKCIICAKIHVIPKNVERINVLFSSSTLFGLEKEYIGEIHFNQEMICGATLVNLVNIWRNLYKNTNNIYNCVIVCGLNDIMKMPFAQIKKNVLLLFNEIKLHNVQNKIVFVKLFQPPIISLSNSYSEALRQLNLLYEQISDANIDLSRYGIRLRNKRKRLSTWDYRYSHFREYHNNKYKSHLEKKNKCLHLIDSIRKIAYLQTIEYFYEK
jgi:hypothetical protein